MISVGNNKAVICKGDFHPAALYKGDKKIAGYTVENFEGTGGVTLENCYNDKVYNAYVHGKNLLDVKKVYPTCANDEGGITFTRNTVRQVTSISMLKSYKENVRYTFSCDYEITLDDNNFYPMVQYTDGTIERFYYAFCESTIGTYSGSYKLTTKPNKTVSKIAFGCSTAIKTVNGKLRNVQLEEGATATEYEAPLTEATVTVRGKNYFDLDKVPFSNNATQPYNNGLIATKLAASNRGDRIPILLPADKTIYITLDIVDSQIDGTAKRVTLDFLDSGYSRVFAWNITSTIAHKSYSYTPTKEIKYVQFYFQSASSANAVGDYVIMDNIMLRTEGNDTFELYIEPQTIPFENGEPTKDIPTFRGTTVIEVESDVPATISGKYKKVEV